MTSNSSEFSPGRDYTVNNGYVAYTNYVNGIKQIFLWKDGNSKQLTYFGTDSYIQSLSAQGYVVARINNGDYFIKNHGSQPIKLYMLDGLKHYWVNNELFGAIGGSILKIETNIVPVVPVTGVTLSNTELKLTKGQKAVLSVSIAPTNGTNKNVTWSSNNENVATVDNEGNVSAIKAGSATITVASADYNLKANCVVTVKVKATEVNLIEKIKKWSIKNRGFAKNFYKQLIIDFIKQYGATRASG